MWEGGEARANDEWVGLAERGPGYPPGLRPATPFGSPGALASRRRRPRRLGLLFNSCCPPASCRQRPLAVADLSREICDDWRGSHELDETIFLSSVYLSKRSMWGRFPVSGPGFSCTCQSEATQDLRGWNCYIQPWKYVHLYIPPCRAARVSGVVIACESGTKASPHAKTPPSRQSAPRESQAKPTLESQSKLWTDLGRPEISLVLRGEKACWLGDNMKPGD